MHSIDGHFYYITYIDELSRKMWIYYLKLKDESFEMFKEFKGLVEKKTRNKIKIFKYKNGGEYISKEIIDFCKKEGIKKETIVSYTPKQNGMEKRKNKSIIEFARAMLHDQKFRKLLWGEANDSVYVQNRVPHQ